MPKNNRPEFTWVEEKQLYKKQMKNPQTGKWLAIYGKTKAELRERVREKEAEFAEAANPQSPYVFEYAAKWYELNTAGLSPSGRQSHRNAINNHICPVIGQMRLDEVRPDNIRAVMLAAANLSKASQQKIVTTLKMMFAAAEENELISRSPCRGLKAGGSKPPEKVALTKVQQAALIKELQGERILTFVMLCMYAGLRREEALGLQWDCVDLDGKAPHIRVRRALRWEHNQPVLTDKLKSKSARRDVPIPPILTEHLRSIKRDSGYVCCRRDGSPHTSMSFRHEWEAVAVREVHTVTYKDNKNKGKTITKELKIGDDVPYRNIKVAFDFHVTRHLLRHTYISELILSGADVKTAQYLAGHATAAITLNIYAHLMQNRPEDTAKSVLAAFSSQDTFQDT